MVGDVVIGIMYDETHDTKVDVVYRALHRLFACSQEHIEARTRRRIATAVG